MFDKLGLSREELAAAGALAAEELEAAIIADFEEQERLRATAPLPPEEEIAALAGAVRSETPGSPPKSEG